jgi:hypothetical protein
MEDAMAEAAKTTETYRKHPDFKCYECDGTGEVEGLDPDCTITPRHGWHPLPTHTYTCGRCNGLGYDEEYPCDGCNEWERTIDLEQLPGSEDWLCKRCRQVTLIGQEAAR